MEPVILKDLTPRAQVDGISRCSLEQQKNGVFIYDSSISSREEVISSIKKFYPIKSLKSKKKGEKRENFGSLYGRECGFSG